MYSIRTRLFLNTLPLDFREVVVQVPVDLLGLTVATEQTPQHSHPLHPQGLLGASGAKLCSLSSIFGFRSQGLTLPISGPNYWESRHYCRCNYQGNQRNFLNTMADSPQLDNNKNNL